MTDRDFPDPVDDDYRDQFPFLRSLGDQFLELVDDHAGIRLIFEMSHPGLTFGMVAGGPEKQHFRTGRWIAYLCEKRRRIESLRYDRNPAPYSCPFHRLGVYGAPPILYLRSLSPAYYQVPASQ